MVREGIVVTATVGARTWVIDDSTDADWHLDWLVMDLCEGPREGQRTLISQLTGRTEPALNQGPHSATTPELSAVCLRELERTQAVSEAIDIVNVQRGRLIRRLPRRCEDHIAGVRSDFIKVGYGNAALLRWDPKCHSGHGFRHVVSLGAHFVQENAAPPLVVLRSVRDGETADDARAAAHRRVLRGHLGGEIRDWVAYMEASRPGPETLVQANQVISDDGVVTYAAVLDNGEVVPEVAIERSRASVADRYEAMWRALADAWAASVRSGTPVTWRAMEQ